MPDSIDSPEETFPVTITSTGSACCSAQPTIAGRPKVTSSLDAAIADNVLIFSEIDHLLATASALARYYDRTSVGDAIVLAIRINKMDYEGRRFELTRREEPL